MSKGKPTAKKAAPKSEGVEIVLLKVAHNEQPGDVRTVPEAQAETLVRRGQARFVDDSA